MLDHKMFRKTDPARAFFPRFFVIGAVLLLAVIPSGAKLGASEVKAEPTDMVQYFFFVGEKPSGQPSCGDFEQANWPALAHTMVNPRGFTPSSYEPKDGIPGALFAGPYQWGGERCGGWCSNVDGQPICFLRPYLVPKTKPKDQPTCGDFEQANWPASGYGSASPRGFTAAGYQPKDGFPGALFAGPYQWGGERCGGWCSKVDGQPICYLRNFPSPKMKPKGQPTCGDFEQANWPASGYGSANPRGFTAAGYQPKDGFPGALFAGPYQWGGERCGGWCSKIGGQPDCFLRSR